MLTTESRGLVDRGAACATGTTEDQIVSGRKRPVRRHKQGTTECDRTLLPVKKQDHGIFGLR